jgi:hypothetical protein
MVKSRRSASLAQGRDLERLRFDDQRHRAVVDAGRHAFDAGRLGAANDFGGQRRGRYVDVAEGNIQECIANRAADHAGLLAVAVQQCEHPRGRT